MKKMRFKVGDEITFDGSKDKTKDVYFHHINDTKILVAQPKSHFRVKELYPPYYICEKLWETGDEAIPVLGGGVFIHEDETIPYDKSFQGTVKNNVKPLTINKK